MDWRIKALALAALRLVPWGRTLYRHYQGRRASEMRDADELLSRGLDLLALYRESGGDVRDRDCLEIGTGWCPWVPLLLAVCGARQVVTLDINPWLSHQTAVNTTREMASRARQLADPLRVSEETIRARLQAAVSAPTLDAWQAALGVRYIQTSLVAANLPAASIDVVFSSNVLEHVVPKALDEMHRESARVLRRGGRIVHRFNPQDHHSGGDHSITGANFLRFSERQWYWFGGSGLAFHNRLRCPQHQARIVQAGFDVVLTRTRPDARARLAIESGTLRVHQDFAGFSVQDLTDDYMWIVAEKAVLPVHETRAPPDARSCQ